MWLAFALHGVGVASAQNYDLSYTANGISVMGTFVITAQGNGRHLINSITGGTRGGSAITLLASGSYGGDNNVLYCRSTTVFNTNGMSFSAGGVNCRVYCDFGADSCREARSDGAATHISDPTITRVAPAPHPGGGLPSFLALELIGRRRAIVARIRARLVRPEAGVPAAPARRAH